MAGFHPPRPGWFCPPADTSTWADRIRSDHSYDWVKPLHYVNVAEGAASFDMQRDGLGGKCVVGAIDRFTAVLRDPNAPAIHLPSRGLK